MTLRRHSLLFALLLPALGCGDDSTSFTDPSTAQAGDASTPPRPGAPGESAQCMALAQSAWRLADEIRKSATCDADADCRLERLQVACLSPFLCDIAVNQDGVAVERIERAVELSNGYQGGETCACPRARCATQRAYCHPTKRRCMSEIVSSSSKPSGGGGGLKSDASVSLDGALPPTNAASSDASSSTSDAAPRSDAGTNPYACRQPSDCAIRNVGNCCGYYPRCVNANAPLTPPDCSGGMAGVCGFPEISSCDCRNETCVSLQNGNPI